MNRDQLAHVLRAASVIVSDDDILVVGSQSILGSLDADRIPREATMSVEVDLVFFDDPDETKMDQIDGAIGENSMFHAEFGYYAQGVSMETSILPDGWRDRLIPFRRSDAGTSDAFCLDGHDLVVAKLAADREKDREFATALIEAQLIHVRVLLDRVELLNQPEALKARTRDAIRSCAHAAGCG